MSSGRSKTKMVQTLRVTGAVLDILEDGTIHIRTDDGAPKKALLDPAVQKQLQQTPKAAEFRTRAQVDGRPVQRIIFRAQESVPDLDTYILRGRLSNFFLFRRNKRTLSGTG